ncbi:MAG TPA: AIR synthase-related protein, partial [Longimicrobiaceae bacterium]|nr:AIR synthase-related protein [Longimicrobiaceae bacterium]
RALLGAIRAGLVRSAHDCAEGGLAVALAESALADAARLFGVEVALQDDLPTTALLFGEAQSRVVVSCRPEDADALLARMEKAGVPAARVGRVGAVGGDFTVMTRGATLSAPISELAEVYYDAIPRRMDGRPQEVDAALHSEVSE